MDARDRLRRYVEQRRELGETEFVLDTLPVDDVLRMLGAPHANRSAAPGASPRVAETMHRDANQPVPTDATSAATNAEVEAEAPELPGTSASVPAVEPPPTPEVRYDAAGSTDWRSALTPPAPDAPIRQPRDAKPVDLTNASLAPTASLPAWLAALDLPVGLNVGSVRDTLFRGSMGELPALDAVASAIRECQACALHASALHAVPGEGSPDADFVCVGEAPGASEDESGRPFVGAAGQLLTKILAAIHFAREEVFICNVLKHRPPGNRNPLPDEVRACSPFLVRQLELLRPRVILALGTFAAQTLLETPLSIGKLRGMVHRYHGIPLVVTYHPAALLRNEAWKRPTWEDVKLARRILDASRAANPSA